MFGLFVFIVGLVGVVSARVVEPANKVDRGARLADTDVISAYVIFRHGDRTPDQEELDYFPTDEKDKDVFFPYGIKALTNKGKQRGYLVGQYLRHQYDSLISRLYLPDEIKVRTTEYARTKMTALTALAAIYPPLPAQKWNPMLDWQPIPYDTKATDIDELQYWSNCPRYPWLRNKIYEYKEMKALMAPYQYLFTYLSEKTGSNITKPNGVFYLDNLFQTLENVGIKPPKWAQDVMPKIKEITKIEYAAEFFTPEQSQLASGVLLQQILNATDAIIAGDENQPKLNLYSAHENNVAALMSASRVFKAHQPNYGSTFSLELRQHRTTGQYGITVGFVYRGYFGTMFKAVYARNAGGPPEILPIQGCKNQLVCDYDTFVELTKDLVLSYDKYRHQCAILE